MAEDNEKIIEKRYIEVDASKKDRFIIGIIGGLGWGIGATIGTAAVLVILGIFVSKINFIPIFGHFSAEVIKAAQANLKAK
jgi:hypothetical protein